MKNKQSKQVKAVVKAEKVRGDTGTFSTDGMLMVFAARRRHLNANDESLASDVDENSKKDRTDSRRALYLFLLLGSSLVLLNAFYGNPSLLFRVEVARGPSDAKEVGDGIRQLRLKESVKQEVQVRPASKHCHHQHAP